jgi:hypothetical protein
VAENPYAWAPDPRPQDRDRRSVYVLSQRTVNHPLLVAFDLPDRNSSCPVRAQTVTAPQALVMLNGPFALSSARHLAESLLARDHRDVRSLVRHAYLAVLGREPDSEEMSASTTFLAVQARVIASGNDSPRTGGVTPPLLPALPGVPPPLASAVVDFCHALFNSAEFLDVE